LWFSDDAARVPLQMVGHTDFGKVTLFILDYQPGNGTPLRNQ
jgi:hypothetical protein